MSWNEKLSTGGSLGDVDLSTGCCFFFISGLVDGPRTSTGFEGAVFWDWGDKVWEDPSVLLRRMAACCTGVGSLVALLLASRRCAEMEEAV